MRAWVSWLFFISVPVEAILILLLLVGSVDGEGYELQSCTGFLVDVDGVIAYGVLLALVGDYLQVGNDEAGYGLVIITLGDVEVEELVHALNLQSAR